MADTNTQLVKFKTGTRAQYEALTTKDSNTLYFLNDTFQIMKGSDLYCKSFATVSTKPATGVKDTLYIVKDEKKLYTFNGTGFVEALDTAMTLATSVTQTDTKPVTSAAVYTYVTGEISKLTGGTTNAFVTSVTAKENDPGVLIVKNGSNKDDTTEVVLTGLTKKPSYNSTTRKITFPIVGESDVEINLGKDLVVTSGIYNSESKEIILTIADDASSQVKIPVTDLVNIYTASTDKTGAAEITITNNAIKASVLVDNSTIKIENNKIKADFSSLALKSEFNTYKDDTNAKITNLTNSIEDLKTTLTWEAIPTQ